MAELSTLGGVIKTAYEGQADTNAFTDAEKAKLAGLTQPDLDFVPLDQKAAANGVATLDASGKVPLNQLNVSGLQFKGAWNPNTNTPSIVDGTGTTGDFYKASVAGTFNAGNGSHTYAVGDWVIYAGGTWTRLGSADSVSMVNGQVGNVVLNAASVGALPDTYTPPNQVKSWNEITNKPDFPALYQKKQRGNIGPAIPAGMWRKTAVQSVPHNTYTIVSWNSSIYDQFGIWDGTSVFTIPSWAKYARVTCMVYYASNTTGFRQLGITLNGAFVLGVGNDAAAVPSVDLAERGLSKSFTTPVFPVSAGQALRIQTAQTSGASLDILAPDPALRRDSSVYIELFE